ncbi:MAG: alpha/beta fold hydrolase [Actinomycetota bacterium]|nr:alpha/beta fold hydrolase [Actinomycetota bacterium]
MSPTRPYPALVDVGVLGPLALRVNGRDVRPAARMERVLLAALAARANQVVSVEQLVDVLWGDMPPRSAHKTLQTYVLKLRRALASVETIAPGYLLRVEPGGLDALRFERLVHSGQEAQRAGDLTRASAQLGDALGLWRGSAYEEFAELPFFVPEAVRLEELRLTASEDRFDALLALGQHAAVTGALQSFTAQHPLRERVWGQLMLAQYRCGRQADALATYQQAREALVEELGLEPGPALRQREKQVLAQDGALDLAAAADTAANELPPTQYVFSDDAYIAYQAIGVGPPDVLMLNEWWSHIEVVWEYPVPAAWLRRTTSIGRLIHFDGRGCGMSDPIDHTEHLTLEGWMDDALAVLDAAGADRVIAFGQGTGASLAVLLAAVHPERVSHLVLHNAQPSWADTSMAALLSQEQVAEALLSRWGHGPGLPIVPALAGNAEFDTWFGRWQRLAVSPGQLPHRLNMVFNVDVRGLLPTVTAPALVLHARDDQIVPFAAAERVAAGLANGELVALDGDHHVWFASDLDDFYGALSSFLARHPEPLAPTQAVVTLLALADGSAPELAPLLTRLVNRYGGQLVSPELAVFDGPVRAVTCATALTERARQLEVTLRAGVHLGVVAIGADPSASDTAVAARHLCTTAAVGEVLVTQAVADLIAGSGLRLRARLDGNHVADGMREGPSG